MEYVYFLQTHLLGRVSDTATYFKFPFKAVLSGEDSGLFTLLNGRIRPLIGEMPLLFRGPAARPPGCSLPLRTGSRGVHHIHTLRSLPRRNGVQACVLLHRVLSRSA